MSNLLRDAIRVDDPLADEVNTQTLKPLAVVVVSDKYILSDPAVQPWGLRLYTELQILLEEKGFRIEFDPGEPYTTPNRQAAVWIGHDKGTKRFHRAPQGMRLIKLETQAAYEEFSSIDQRRRNEANYLLSQRDLDVLNALEV